MDRVKRRFSKTMTSNVVDRQKHCLKTLRVDRGGERYFLVKGQWGGAAGWGRIFTTGLTILGLYFSRVTRMGSHIFGISGMRKIR